MNHVILLLRPLKMKDWLLRGIKSIAVSKMNFASECTPSATEEEDRGCSRFIPWTALLCRATLRRVAKNNGQLHTTQQLLHSSCTNRDQKDVVSHYSVLQAGQDTQKTVCCISSLEGSIHKAFSWYYITAFSEPQILHKYWKSTEGIVTQTAAFHTIVKLHCFRAADIAPYCAQHNEANANIVRRSPTKNMSKRDDSHINWTHISNRNTYKSAFNPPDNTTPTFKYCTRRLPGVIPKTYSLCSSAQTRKVMIPKAI